MSSDIDSAFIPGGGEDILKDALKSSFLVNFRTGNVLVDTLIAGFVIGLSTYLMSFVRQLQQISWQTIMSYFYKPEEIRERKIIISCKPSSRDPYDGGSSATPLFNAVLHRIKKIDCDTSGIVEMCEVRLEKDSDHNQRRELARLRRQNPYQEIHDLEPCNDMNEESKKHTNLVVSQSSDFELEKNVFGNVKISSVDKNNKQDDGRLPQGEKQFQITIKSQVLTMNELRLLVQKWVQEYLEYKEPNDILFFYQHLHDFNFSEYRFESSKNFSNLFFPEKQMLVDHLEYFLHNEAWYKEKGLPYTLGFLFHGEPGCGKTSTIKAIANYTKRHIVSLSLKNIKNKKDLFNIFYQDYINDRKVPLRKRLYILEDVDCSELEDVVRDRSSRNQEDTTSNSITANDFPNLSFRLELPTSELKKFGLITDKKIKDSSLTLADILETLDGVMEMDGRILIMTTNYPENLDSALTRPGRIDFQLKFGKCTSGILMQMYEHFCATPQLEDSISHSSEGIWPKNFNKTSLPSNRWSPAEATQILVRNIRTPCKGLLELSDCEDLDD